MERVTLSAAITWLSFRSGGTRSFLRVQLTLHTTWFSFYNLSTTTRGQQTFRLTCGTILFDFAGYNEIIFLQLPNKPITFPICRPLSADQENVTSCNAFTGKLWRQIRLATMLFCLKVMFFSKAIDVLKTRNSQAMENHYSLIVFMHAKGTLMFCLKRKRSPGYI